MAGKEAARVEGLYAKLANKSEVIAELSKENIKAEKREWGTLK